MSTWELKNTLTIDTSSKIRKLAHIRMKFGGIMQAVGNER